MDILLSSFGFIAAFFILATIIGSFFTVQTAQVAVITRFGRATVVRLDSRARRTADREHPDDEP